MILYAFECNNCTFIFNGEKKLNEPNIKCPKCGSDTSIVITNNVMVKFKGIGFHCNDYNEWCSHNH